MTSLSKSSLEMTEETWIHSHKNVDQASRIEWKCIVRLLRVNKNGKAEKSFRNEKLESSFYPLLFIIRFAFRSFNFLYSFDRQEKSDNKMTTSSGGIKRRITDSTTVSKRWQLPLINCRSTAEKCAAISLQVSFSSSARKSNSSPKKEIKLSHCVCFPIKPRFRVGYKVLGFLVYFEKIIYIIQPYANRTDNTFTHSRIWINLLTMFADAVKKAKTFLFRFR